MNKRSIFYRMTSFVIALVFMQSIFFTGMMIFGGVLREAKENAYQTFSEKVKNRNNYIQSQMKNNWTNMGVYSSQISRALDYTDHESDFFDTITDTLIAMLRSTQTTGAYVLLNDDSNQHPVLYVRDYDPMLNDSSNKDLYMLYGDSKIASHLHIPLDQTWNYRFEKTEENQSFIEKPLSKATLSYQADLIGYWSVPFRLNPKDMEVITYSMPLFDSKKELRGIIGVEISINHLTKLLPLTGLRPTDSLGYLLAYKEQEEGELIPVVMTGALQKRMIQAEEAFILETIDEEQNLYEIVNTQSKEAIYAVLQRLGVYNVNTPFEHESWYLIGMLQEDYLLNYANRIEHILWMAFFASLILGVAGAYLLSYRFTKPITHLVRQLKNSDKYKHFSLDQTGLSEIDELSDAMIAANNEVIESTVKMSKIIGLSGFSIGAFEAKADLNQVLLTDQLATILDFNEAWIEEGRMEKEKFLELFQEKIAMPLADEDEVYEIDNRFIRIKRVENESGLMGVAIDVSREIREKQRIRKERDYDPLTKIYNRKAVQEQIERLLVNAKELKAAAFIMFDLDYLKQINDSYGHQWGDIYIQKAVEALGKIDLNKGILGRRSGDEFILFVYGYVSKDEILGLMDRFYTKLKENPIQYPDGESKPITISGGLVWIHPPVEAYEEYMHRADALLYKAKFENKGSYEYEELDG